MSAYRRRKGTNKPTRTTRGANVGEVIARSALTIASYQTCLSKLGKGQVKRVLQRGPLVGYYLACPSCNGAFAYLHDKCGFVEAEPYVGTSWPRRLVGVERPPTCYHCKATLSIESGVDGFEIVARRSAP